MEALDTIVKILKFDYMTVTTKQNKTIVNFKIPFKNKCLAVMAFDNASEFGEPVSFGASPINEKTFYLSSSDKTSTNHACCIFSVGY